MLAFVIDTVLLGIAASVLCLPFFEELTSLGAWGRVFGFLVSLAYFAYFDSGYGHGRTLGKRLLAIKLVDVSGNALSVEKAALRAAVLSIPFFVSGPLGSLATAPAFFAMWIAAVVLLISVANDALLLFNVRTRQGLHDLSVGSYVVDEWQAGHVEASSLRPGLLVVLGLAVGVGSLLLTMAGQKLASVGPFPRLIQDGAQLEAIPGVEGANVQYVNFWTGQTHSRRAVVVTLSLRGRAGLEEAAANRAA